MGERRAPARESASRGSCLRRRALPRGRRRRRAPADPRGGRREGRAAPLELVQGAAARRGRPGTPASRRASRPGASPRAPRASACRAARRARRDGRRGPTTRSARPTTRPACGPPKSLSPENVTRSGAVGEAVGDRRLAGDAELLRAARRSRCPDRGATGSGPPARARRSPPGSGRAVYPRIS